MRIKSSISAALFAAIISAATVPAQAESMRDALASAYASNPNIASALLSVKASAEDIAIRRAGKLPNISASAEAAGNWSVAGGVTTTSNSASLGLTYNHTLFDNLRTDAQIEQARALTEVSKQALRSAEQNVLLSAATAYANVVRDTQLAQLRQEAVSFFQAQVNSAQERLEIGEGTRINVSQAQASLAQAVASYRDAVTSLQTSRASYERWVGNQPQNLNLSFDFRGALPGTLNQALNEADRNHPAILTAQAQVRAAQAGADAAAAAFGPTLNLIGSINTTVVPSVGQTSGMSGSVRLQLTVPIYSGGATGASVRQANLNQIGSELDALAARDQVRESVISAWNGVQSASSQIESAQSQVQASQAVLDGVIEERNVGQSTTLDVLDARSNLTSAQEIVVSATSSRIIARFSLLQAVGQLTAGDLGLPVQIRSSDGYVRNVEDVWAELRSLPDN